MAPASVRAKTRPPPAPRRECQPQPIDETHAVQLARHLAEQEKAAEKLPPSLSDLWHFPEHFPFIYFDF
jgi:hypothetical protein